MRIDRSILPSGRIGLAVSGGADSVALAFLLTKGGRKRNAAKRFVILHVDHGLRPEAKAEYRFVRALAKRLGVPFRGLRAKVVRRPGESLEMAARRVRLAFFETCVRKLKLDAIATGHHMDDVAETFLMRLKRASGPVGLAGIKPTSAVGGIRFVRPLLGCRDAELKAYLAKYGETWCEDASNGDTSIERNRVRHEVIPFLEKSLDPHLVEHVAKICRILQTARAVLLLAILALVLPASAIEASSRYRSPRNPERKIRTATTLIILHTTEAPARSSLNKLQDRGEAHFCVTEDGGVYRIVDRDREAFHAGRSMWCGKEDVDKFSIGIECVGYHNKPMPSVQLAAIRNLVKDLQAMYSLSDDKVIAHSHVAYGAPNKWHRYKHRGRKRCGMLFAMPSVRRQLGLKTRPAYDPDTRAGRLRNADPYLATALYGSTDTMGRHYGGAVAPAAPTGVFKWFNGKPKSASAPTKQPAKPAHRPAPKFQPNSIAELKRCGYVLKGTITKTLTAAKIAGRRWNAADTYYTIRDKVTPGNRIDSARIEKGMGVWMRK